MSVITAPLKNEIAMQKDIFRLAAAIYSESSNAVSEADTQMEMVKCMFTVKDNVYMTISEIISNLLDVYKYHVSSDEIDGLIKKSRSIFLSVKKDDEEAFCLTQNAFDECKNAEKNNIDSFIDDYIATQEINDAEKCKNAIHMYLYELTTSNINSYRILLAGKDGTQFTSSELSVDISNLNDDEKHLVHNFLTWENSDKNIALGNLVYCCLEYCLLINGDSPNELLKNFIRKREIYLDTNVIFRALGINGAARQTVICAFLDKCKQAKLKLIVSRATNKEFFDTINYYVAQMEYYPRGNIYSGAYEEISDYNIFAFYENWRKQHSRLPLKYFVFYVRSLYSDLIEKYSVTDSERIPGSIYDSDDFKNGRNRYSSAIKCVKQGIKDSYLSDDDHYTQRDSHDATVVRYIELLRQKSGDNKDIFFVSSDKALRLWDMNRSENNYPVVVYPSQLFLILLKTCGRAKNDYDSFVSFINIRSYSNQITPENANIILSGISSITEDIKTQKHLVEAVYGDDFQNIISSSTSDKDLYEKVQRITQNYLEDQLKESEKKKASLQKTVETRNNEINQLHGEIAIRDEKLEESQSEISKRASESEEKRKRIAAFAERKTKLQYLWKVYGIPVILLLLVLLIVSFIVLQFFAADAKWNYVIKVFEWIKTTPFGNENDSVMYIVDVAILAIVSFVVKHFWRNPFNKAKNQQLSAELVQKYITKNQLD